MPSPGRERRSLSVEQFRAAASELLIAANSADHEIAEPAISRFHALPSLVSRTTFSRRDAMAVIAAESGLPSRSRGEPGGFDPSRLFTGRADEYLNFWCRSYEEAKSVHVLQPDHVLFPFGNQHVLVDPALLRYHSIDSADPDWVAIGRDWVHPLDKAAYARLEAKLIAASE